MAYARRFDLKTRRWTELPDFVTARINAAAAVVAGKVVLAGGTDASIASLDSVEIFDIARCRWSAGSRLPKPASRPAVVAVGDR